MSIERIRGLGPCDLLTIQEACRVLRINDHEGRAWLQDRGLIRRFCGRPRVKADELCAAYDGAALECVERDDPPPAEPTRRRARKKKKRLTLDDVRAIKT